ncbi:hypothetical protein RKD29_004585 [Streptomyces tendae]|uniref:hypothetical protein n=1 Tax=Streptomyces tendae TaxID=1932 RepID=UPI003837C28A
MYQTWNRSADDFSYGAGVHAALAAIDWAKFTANQDGGVYHLHEVMQGDGVYVFETGTRVHHRGKTVSHC